MLVGVFREKTAPGSYTMSDIEVKFASKYKHKTGVTIETRPYHLIRGIPNLQCKWRWIVPHMSVGWVDIRKLHALPENDVDFPGFKRELIFYR